jgi:hypothetical protein
MQEKLKNIKEIGNQAQLLGGICLLATEEGFNTVFGKMPPENLKEYHRIFERILEQIKEKI